MGFGLYDVQNPAEKAIAANRGASAANANIGIGFEDKQSVEKTAGGAIMSAGSMAAAGATVGGPWGAAAGAVVGLAGYLLS